ncbi:MAG: phage portal protein [Candidatus Merdivicinus sp.]|jgi:SPP1 family phage portal protein
MTETEKIIRHIEACAPMQDADLASIETNRFLSSPKREWMLVGQQYYQNRSDILSRRRWVIGENGLPKEDPTLINCKIAHGFLRKLVDQKCQYLFGKPFTIRTDDPAFEDALQKVFGRELRNRMKNLCKEAINKGIAWLQVYIDNGQIRFAKIPAEQVVPLWADEEHTRLDGVIRVFEQESFSGLESRTDVRAEYWHPDGVDSFFLRDGKLVPDPENWGRAHLTIDGKPYNFEEIPFIPFKYNEEELPLIRFVKPLIDDYELLKSEDANALLDTPNAVMVLTNYDGEDLGEFRRNLAQYKAVKVSDNGGLDIKSSPCATDAVNAHLERTRKDLYEAGRGVDTQKTEVGNLSGVALRFLYADLDLDCSGIETEFAAGFEKMLSFIRSYLFLSGKGDFFQSEASLILNRDILINEAEAIQSCVQSASILSARTILENHPWVESAAEEQKRRNAETISQSV